jgi:acetyl-CoA carboxylase beta subunit
MKKLSHKIINANAMEYEKKRPDASGASGIARGTAIKSLGLGVLAAAVGWRLTGVADAAPRTQGGWRWCNKCEGMFYAVSTMNHMGVCPAGGHHDDSGSGHYMANVGESVSGKQQGGWRWCHKCEGMFYAVSTMNHMGVCPAGGHHDNSGSGHYAAISGEDASVGDCRQQGGWRWCHKCEGMFYARASAGKGVCPARGHHDDSGSSHYAFLF